MEYVLGKNSSGRDVYQSYSLWCNDSGIHPLAKSNFFEELTRREKFAKSGRVDGVPSKNVVKGYQIKEGAKVRIPF